jgi:hypothetical protein
VSETTLPHILVIDDEPDSQRGVFRLADASVALFDVHHPEEVDADLLDSADLVLVDYLIDNWATRDSAPQLGLKPVNGVALSALLREHAGKLDRPTGFALNTGNPAALWITPAETRAHIIARAYNLEWIFLKDDGEQNIRQATSLAEAIRALPRQWPGEDHEKATNLVLNLLGLMKGDDEDSVPTWTTTALSEVESCRPPLTELAERNHGLLFLRWLLQRILPYPCFLYDSHRLASRLRVSHPSLQAALNGELANWLEPYRFQGVLHDFVGDRWWRAGIEIALWELTDGASVPASELRKLISQVADVELEPSDADNPILCIDENYRVIEQSFAPSQVVRIQPDDWPGYANQAWTTRELAKAHPRLKAMVIDEEQDRVEDSDKTPPDTEASR